MLLTNMSDVMNFAYTFKTEVIILNIYSRFIQAVVTDHESDIYSVEAHFGVVALYKD